MFRGISADYHRARTLSPLALMTAAAAVLGLLLIRAGSSFVPSLTFEFATNRLTYLYVFLATATVFLVLGMFSVAVTGIVTGLAPQLNVMMPPAVAAACSAANVQLAALPVPTTAVGLATLAA